ncbi:MAG: hypothetical protein AB1779_08205, partial [Candidatus Thermoplasmatota archaeon]
KNIYITKIYMLHVSKGEINGLPMPTQIYAKKQINGIIFVAHANQPPKKGGNADKVAVKILKWFLHTTA